MSVNVSITNKREADESGETPAKRRRVDEEKIFKKKAQDILGKLSDAVPNSFAAIGRLNAPTITIAMKHSRTIVHFPLYESEAPDVIKSFVQSPYGKGITATGSTVVNSWELSSGGFEILNPAWNNFVNNEFVSRIKKEMFIEFPFTPSLHTLVLYKEGEYQTNEKSDSVDGTFAKVFIQLPSLYKGGELLVHHDGRTVKSDFSSAESNHTFGTFFTAFYMSCCEQSICRVTEGYRVCLVYHLNTRRSVIPTVPKQHSSEGELMNLFKNWEHGGKLVYALKHNLSNSLEYALTHNVSMSNLSFDNLEGTDRSIANFLLYVAKKTDLCIYLTNFNKESFGQGNAAKNFHFDSDDENFSRWKSYSLSKLIAADGRNLLSTAPLTVNFDAEVVSEQCFDNIDPHSTKHKLNGIGGVDVTHFHRSSAIVFWPKRFLLEIPRKCGASAADLEKIFLHEIHSYRGQVNDNSVKTKLKNWAKEIISSSGKKSIDVVKAIMEMEDVPLIQSLLSSDIILNEVSLSLVVDVCEKYGWKTFAEQVPQLFKNERKENAIKLLGRIGIEETEEDKKTVVHNSMKVILDQIYFSSYMDGNHRLEQQEFLLSAFRLGEKWDIKMLDIVKDKSTLLIVPVLLRLVPNNSQKLQPFWKDVAQHFVQEMRMEATKPVHTWVRSDRTNCLCTDCITLNAYLASDQETISFAMGEIRRDHLQQGLNQMPNISHQSSRRGRTGGLVIRKTSQTRPSDDAKKRSFSIANLPLLFAILPN